MTLPINAKLPILSQAEFISNLSILYDFYVLIRIMKPQGALNPHIKLPKINKNSLLDMPCYSRNAVKISLEFLEAC
jgi:hypothetical protein